MSLDQKKDRQVASQLHGDDGEGKEAGRSSLRLDGVIEPSSG